MKPIDAEPIIKNLSSMKTQLGYDAIDIDGMIKALREAKEVKAELIPPNDPLTLEQLKAMEGEPVWVSYPRAYQKDVWWSVVECANLEMRSLTLQKGHLLKYGEHWICYRRKPEDEDNETD